MTPRVDEFVQPRIVQDWPLKARLLLEAIDLLEPFASFDAINYAAGRYINNYKSTDTLIDSTNEFHYIFSRLQQSKEIIRFDGKWTLSRINKDYPTLVDGYSIPLSLNQW